MTEMNGAAAIVKCLVEEGVKIIYGYPGGAVAGTIADLAKAECIAPQHMAEALSFRVLESRKA